MLIFFLYYIKIKILVLQAFLYFKNKIYEPLFNLLATIEITYFLVIVAVNVKLVYISNKMVILTSARKCIYRIKIIFVMQLSLYVLTLHLLSKIYIIYKQKKVRE